MPWVVDTCILVDVLVADPTFGEASANCLDRLAAEGLTISPVTYVEMAPAFRGNVDLQHEFLDAIGIDFYASWTWTHTQAAHAAWHRLVERRRQGSVAKRPIADVLIGAFATTCSGLVTRNPRDFEPIYPELRLLAP